MWEKVRERESVGDDSEREEEDGEDVFRIWEGAGGDGLIQPNREQRNAMNVTFPLRESRAKVFKSKKWFFRKKVMILRASLQLIQTLQSKNYESFCTYGSNWVLEVNMKSKLTTFVLKSCSWLHCKWFIGACYSSFWNQNNNFHLMLISLGPHRLLNNVNQTVKTPLNIHSSRSNY